MVDRSVSSDGAEPSRKRCGLLQRGQSLQGERKHVLMQVRDIEGSHPSQEQPVNNGSHLFIQD